MKHNDAEDTKWNGAVVWVQKEWLSVLSSGNSGQISLWFLGTNEVMDGGWNGGHV